MIRIPLILILLCFLAFPVRTDENPELQRIRSLEEALRKDGVAGLLAVAKQNSWLPPAIPSEWHVTHVGKPDALPICKAARTFGKTLAVQLDEMDRSFVTPSTVEELNSRVVALCDLADWCTSTDGYGNLLLAQKCLDLAAIGMARLTVNLDVHTNKIEVLSRRLDATWMSPATRGRVLNADAGAEIFGGTQEDMDRTWGSGGVLMRDELSPGRKDERDRHGGGKRLIETPVIKNNLAFFQDDATSETGTSLTAIWDHKYHERLVTGLELRSIEEAKALLRFRERIGRFPTEDNPASLYRGSKGAFTEAWRATVVITPTMSHSELNKELGIGIIAWRAYDKVMRGDHPPRQ